ncbi:hypothetical protein [Actinomadura alba]|uniref:Uncharacterized protein n=1 Tax=Actinomadura alba TaxID=406431 RepID=A0ABR7LIF9_9ACTN|nr:hypothetical protein [Actinomadura alba]MBC6464290.1 hypothetical protein [Actinomadura alba]
MTTLPTSRPEPGSVRERQAKALITAFRLMAYDLPTLAHVNVDRDGVLRLQVSATLSDADDLAAVHAWAEFLDAEMTTRDVEGHRSRIHVSTQTTFRDVPVEAWTSFIPAAPALAKGGASSE